MVYPVKPGMRLYDEEQFGPVIPVMPFDDLDTVIAELSEAVNRGRRGEGPTYLVANTYRFRGHSMSDAMKYRSKEEMDKARQRDPISLYQLRLRD